MSKGELTPPQILKLHEHIATNSIPRSVDACWSYLTFCDTSQKEPPQPDSFCNRNNGSRGKTIQENKVNGYFGPDNVDIYTDVWWQAEKGFLKIKSEEYQGLV